MSAHLDASVETPDHEANRSSSRTGIGMLATRWSIRQLATLTVGLVLATAPAPAMADTKVFDDPVGDSTFVDISRVRVVHRDSVIVRVRSAVPLTAGQLYALWIDAGHGRRPDYYVDFRANAGFDEVLRRVRFFGDRRSLFVQCPGMRPRADINRRQAGVDPNPATLLEQPRERPGRRAVQGREHGHRGLGRGSPNFRALGQAVARTAARSARPDRRIDQTAPARLNMAGRPARSCRCPAESQPPATPRSAHSLVRHTAAMDAVTPPPPGRSGQAVETSTIRSNPSPLHPRRARSASARRTRRTPSRPLHACAGSTGDPDARARHLLLVDEVGGGQVLRISGVRGRTFSGGSSVAVEEARHRGALQLGLARAAGDVHGDERDPLLGHAGHHLVADRRGRLGRRPGRRTDEPLQVGAQLVRGLAAGARPPAGQRDLAARSPRPCSPSRRARARPPRAARPPAPWAPPAAAPAPRRGSPPDSPASANMLQRLPLRGARWRATGSTHSRSSKTVVTAMPVHPRERRRPAASTAPRTSRWRRRGRTPSASACRRRWCRRRTLPKFVRRSSNAHHRVFGIPSKTTWVGMNVCTSRLGSTSRGPVRGRAGSSRRRRRCARARTSRGAVVVLLGAQHDLGAAVGVDSPDGAETPKPYSSRDGCQASSESGWRSARRTSARSRSNRSSTRPTSPAGPCDPVDDRAPSGHVVEQRDAVHRPLGRAARPAATRPRARRPGRPPVTSGRAPGPAYASRKSSAYVVAGKSRSQQPEPAPADGHPQVEREVLRAERQRQAAPLDPSARAGPSASSACTAPLPGLVAVEHRAGRGRRGPAPASRRRRRRTRRAATAATASTARRGPRRAAPGRSRACAAAPRAGSTG